MGSWRGWWGLSVAVRERKGKLVEYCSFHTVEINVEL